MNGDAARTTEDAPRRSAPAALAGVPARLAAIAASASGRTPMLRELLRVLCDAVDAPYGLLDVRTGSAVLEDAWHRRGVDPGLWRGPATALLDEVIASGRPRARLYASKGGGGTVAIIGHPVPDAGGATIGGLVLVVPGVDDGLVAGTTSELGRVLATNAFLMSRLEAAPGRDGAPDRFAMAALTEAGRVRSRRHLAFALANGLRARTGTEMVAVGAVEGPRVRLLAISGFDEVKARSPGARGIVAAMEECLDAGHRIVMQPDAAWEDDAAASTRHRLHVAWHRSTGGAAVLSIPLRDGDGPEASIVGIASVRARPGGPIAGDELERIERSLAPYGLLIRTLARADRSLVAHAADATRGWIAELAGPRTLVRRTLVAASVLLLAGWLAFGRLELRVAADARLEPAVSRHVAAAADGVLAAVEVDDGARVAVGEVLARLRTDALELERSRLAASIEVQRLEARRRLVEGDLAGSRLAESEARALEGELALVEERIARSVIRSPIDGTVVSSRPDREIGRAISRGETLFVVAGDEGWTVEVSVPERDADLVAAGMTGRFATRARPDVRHEVRVDRIAASATPADGTNAFVGEASLAEPADWMRPGMEGVARIDTGRRAVWWVLGRRAISWVRRTLWL